MNDLTDLRDAFTELERRADAHPQAELAVRPAPRPSAGHRPPTRSAARRPVLVGATAAVLLAAVAGAVVVTTGSDSSAVRVGGGTTTASAPAAVTSPATSPDPGPTVPVATTTTELTGRFTSALGGIATFTVTHRVEDSSTPPGPGPGSPVRTDPPTSTSPPTPTGVASADPGPTDASDPPSVEIDNHDVLIGGVLTAASGGSGGYDIQTATGWSGPAFCEVDTCEVTTLADGSSLAVATSSVLAADGSSDGGTTYSVCLVRPDGVLVLFHLSDEQDPKGTSGQLSVSPPLTTAQMTTIVTSPRWVVG